jgi:serine protease Do
MRCGGWVGVMTLAAGMTLPGSLYALWGSGVPLGAVSGHGSQQGYLGIEVHGISDSDTSQLKLKDARGAEVVNLDHDGPACKAGIQTHDVILQMNGQAITSEAQLRKMLHEEPPGRMVSFVISRDGQIQTLTMQMADRRTVGMQAWEQHYSVPAPTSAVHVSGFFHSASPSSAAAAPKGHRDFLGTTMVLSSSYTGAKLELMTPQLAQFFGSENGAGLLVRSVDGNSPADLAGMKAGDVVVKVNSVAVSESEWTKAVHDHRGKPVPVVVLRDKQEHTLTMTPDSKKRSYMKGLGLEEFFTEKTQQTRDLLAKL